VDLLPTLVQPPFLRRLKQTPVCPTATPAPFLTFIYCRFVPVTCYIICIRQRTPALQCTNQSAARLNRDNPRRYDDDAVTTTPFDARSDYRRQTARNRRYTAAKLDEIDFWPEFVTGSSLCGRFLSARATGFNEKFVTSFSKAPAAIWGH